MTVKIGCSTCIHRSTCGHDDRCLHGGTCRFDLPKEYGLLVYSQWFPARHITIARLVANDRVFVYAQRNGYDITQCDVRFSGDVETGTITAVMDLTFQPYDMPGPWYDVALDNGKDLYLPACLLERVTQPSLHELIV